MAAAIAQSGSKTQPTHVNNATSHLFTFPPFPQPPQGVHIVPFVDFNERGISTNPGPDEEEVDSTGTPTVIMRVAHATDTRKTNTKRKKQADKQARSAGQQTRQLQWWEEWAKTEVIRVTKSVDPRSSRTDKMHAAILDFTRDRAWPPQVRSETGPKYLWEKFLRFIGLPEGYLPLTEQIQSKKKKRQAEEDDSMSDDSDEEDQLPEAPITAHVDGQTATVSTHKQILTNEDRLQVFLDDPAKAISVFMTSHSWNKGYIWSEDNLFHMPRLLAFLINFLLRSKVFPDLEQEYRRTLEITKAGLVQLPNSANFMKAIPDQLATGCAECWGRKAVTYQFVDIGADNSVVTVPATEVKAKKQKVDIPSAGNSADNGGWGDGGGNSNWGDADAMNAWSSDQLEQMAWESEEKQQPLFSILGPTAFPLTHTTGIVERSMRRIKSIQPPNNNPPKSQGRPEGGPDANGVEIELDRHFSKILLAPMVDWDRGEAPVYSTPTIMESSRGAVVGDGVPGSGLKPHDPNNDDIVVLVESKQANLLREGMGVAGTWVQIARQNTQTIKKKGKNKKPPVYWYLEEVSFVTASFWTFFD